MTRLKTEQLTLAYGETTIINELNLTIASGEVTVLIGSNGCGKSTLLHSLARLLKPAAGQVVLDGELIQRIPTREVAKRLAILPQSPETPEGLTVKQLIKHGRFPHQRLFQSWTDEDEAIVTNALKWTGLTELADRTVDSLSGGQRQRAWIAMTLAQETDIILLDEPTTYLDLAHQIEILDLLNTLNKEHGRTIVMVLHDLNLACRYADQLIAVANRGVYAQGTPDDIMTTSLVEDVFALQSEIIADPLYGTPMVVPFSTAKARQHQTA